MRPKLPKIVLVFGAIGFLIGLAYMVGDGISYRIHDPALDEFLSSSTAVLLCPSSFSLMGLEGFEPPTWFDIAFAFAWVILLNTIWYGFIGFVLSKLSSLFRKIVPSMGRG